MPSFKKLSPLVVMAVLLSSSAAFAGAVKSEAVVGLFGFDWFKPESAKCAAVTAEAAAKFKSCSYRAAGETGSFSGNADYYACQVSEKSELMIYKTKARCSEELEIMKSNGD
ncbi:MAG TPA: hypothetical protein VFX30_11320 [bacterium]|nr:hypothetical protein [bacterium]